MKITGINHVTFATQDLIKALNFYVDLLGCSLVAQWDSGAYLLAGDLWLCLSCDSEAKIKPAGEYSHVAFSIHADDFLDLKAQLLAHEVPTWKENKSQGRSLYILDPDFNKIEIHSSNLKSRIQSIRKHPYLGLKLNEEVIAKL